jgi:hypothetical protein
MREKFDKEASRTRDYCAAAFLIESCATHRAARPDPSLRKLYLLKAGLLRMTNYRFGGRP